MTNQAAKQAQARMAEITARLDEIQQAVAIQYGANVVGDAYHWAHVGDLNRIASSLKEIQSFLGEAAGNAIDEETLGAYQADRLLARASDQRGGRSR